MGKALEKFKHLPPAGQAAIVGVTAWNLWLIGSAQRDISRRAEEQIRGPKWLWRIVCLTNTVGPLAYFRWGRNA